jgi:hypothetical protein
MPYIFLDTKKELLKISQDLTITKSNLLNQLNGFQTGLMLMKKELRNLGEMKRKFNSQILIRS